jgi:DNA replication protein DnaC
MKMNLEDIENQVIKECPDNHCGGTFYTIETKIKYCKCYEKLIRYDKYNKSGIEQEWWDFDKDNLIDDFSKKNQSLIDKYDFFIDNIHLCVKNKIQFWFSGTYGSGKSTIAIMMLKRVLDNGYNGLFLNGFEVIDRLYHDRKHEMDDKAFLVVDEFDKVKKNTIDDFCDLISSYMEKKNIILIGNKDIIQLRRGGYPDFFLDRLDAFSKFTFKEGSYRKKIQPKFETILELNKKK